MKQTGRILLRPVLALAVLIAGAILRLGFHRPDPAHLVWTIGLWGIGLPLLAQTGLGLVRGRFAADLVAALAIIGAMALDQPFAGLVIVLMQTGAKRWSIMPSDGRPRQSASSKRKRPDLPIGSKGLTTGCGMSRPVPSRWET